MKTQSAKKPPKTDEPLTLLQPVKGNPFDPDGYGEIPKPGELIEVVESQQLSTRDRVVYNLLLANAWDTIKEKGKIHKIAKNKLKGSHQSNDRLEDSITKLMGTVVKVILSTKKDQERLRVPLLGPNREQLSKDGYLYYRFADELIDLLVDSNIYAKLNAQILHCLRSKYAVKLYELVERRRNLAFKQEDEFTIEQFRELINVPEGKLARYPDLKKHAIEPALAEINFVCDYMVYVQPSAYGARRKVEKLKLMWMAKTTSERVAARAEAERHRAGRKARREGTVQNVL